MLVGDKRLRVILGGPGCGKTTRAIRIVEDELKGGVAPEQIAFVTFTNAGADQARNRAASSLGLSPEELKWFCTVHAATYRKLGITRDEVMDRRDWKEFADLIGEEISGNYDADNPVLSGTDGDKMLRIIDLSSTMLKGLDEVWRAMDEDVDWHALKRFDESLTRYKSLSGKMDFTDMLLRYIEDGEPLSIRVGIVDESQDLTAAQWAAVEKLFSRAERVYVFGDDDQAIHRWAGADVEYFLGLSRRPEVLEVSHRLPVSVFNLASSISARISRRYQKAYRPTEKPGTVDYHASINDLDLGKGNWMLLARNKFLLTYVEEMLRKMGYNYQTRSRTAVNGSDYAMMKLWESIRKGKTTELTAAEVRDLFRAVGGKAPQLRELRTYDPKKLGLNFERPWFQALGGISEDVRDYYVACLRSGEKLNQPPRITLETIHGVKGKEEDHVVLLTDVSSRTLRSYQINPDNEHRVFYVGVTRAKESLHIISPQSNRYYTV